MFRLIIKKNVNLYFNMHFKKLPSKQKKEAKNNAIDLKCHKKKN